MMDDRMVDCMSVTVYDSNAGIQGDIITINMHRKQIYIPAMAPM